MRFFRSGDGAFLRSGDGAFLSAGDGAFLSAGDGEFLIFPIGDESDQTRALKLAHA